MKRVLLKGEIGAKRAINDAALRRILDQCKGEAITVVIDSPGGDFNHSVACHNLLLKHNREQGEVLTIALEASSGAGLIFIAGSKRMVGINCTLMIHSAHNSSDEMVNAANRWMLDLFARVSNQPWEIRDQIVSGSDVYYDAHDCVRHNLAHIAMSTVVPGGYDYVLQS